MKNKIQNIINFLLKYGLIIISIIIAILGICSIFITAYLKVKYNISSEFTKFKFSFGILEILLAIIFATIFVLISRKLLSKIKSKYILIPLFILILVVFAFWIKVLRIEPLDDQFQVHKIAIDFIRGGIDFHLSNTQYLFLYPYQLGIVYFISLVYRVFGENFMNMQYLNCVCSVLSLILMYLITVRIFDKNERISKLMIVLLTCFSVYWFFLNAQVYGNIPGLTFSLIAVLFTIRYLDSNKFYNILIVGISISIAIILKTNYNIFLCGIGLALILDLISNWKIKKLCIIPIFLIGFFFINISYNMIIEKKYNIKLPDGVPMINFIYMGISDSPNFFPGWYNEETLKVYYEMECDTEATKKEALNRIGQRVEFFQKNPDKFFDYFGKKIGSTWLNPTFQTIWYCSPNIRYMYNQEYATYISYHKLVMDMVAGGGLYQAEEYCMKIYEIIIYAFSATGIFVIAKKKEFSIKSSLLPIIFFGGFLFHIFWETKSVYVIQYYYLLLPFTAYGLDYAADKVINKLEKIIERKKHCIRK